MASKGESLGIAAGIPEAQHIDASGILINGVDNPEARSAANLEEVGMVGSARDEKIAPRVGSPGKLNGENVIEARELFAGKILAVVNCIFAETINFSLRNRGPDNFERHRDFL